MKTTTKNLERKQIRKDGLKIFIEKSDGPVSVWLNHIRLEGTRKEVFLAVGFARGLQIALNYAKKHDDMNDVLFIESQIHKSTGPKTEKQLKLFKAGKK